MLKEHVRSIVTGIVGIGIILIVIGFASVGGSYLGYYLSEWVPFEFRILILVAVLTAIAMRVFSDIRTRLQTLESKNESLRRRVRDLELKKDGP